MYEYVAFQEELLMTIFHYAPSFLILFPSILLLILIIQATLKVQLNNQMFYPLKTTIIRLIEGQMLLEDVISFLRSHVISKE